MSILLVALLLLFYKVTNFNALLMGGVAQVLFRRNQPLVFGTSYRFSNLDSKRARLLQYCVATSNVSFSYDEADFRACSEGLLSANFVEKHRVAVAEISVFN
jgi:uncharacterized membrane protein